MDPSSFPVAEEKRSKSPPLAFEPTPNDTLAPSTSPPTKPYLTRNIDSAAATLSTMGRFSATQRSEMQTLQAVVDQQASALDLAHKAFAMERQSWDTHKDQLLLRIENLENLLKSADGHSPEKSPVLSPQNTSNFASPQSRAAGSNRLPSIAEDENIQPLSQRREGAPQSIHITTTHYDQERRRSSVTFAEDSPTSLRIEEIAPLPSKGDVSPSPASYRIEAGHTPLKAPKAPSTPPPDVSSLATDGIADTPTRNNTQINNYLTESREEDGDSELTGPLNMPELPSEPSNDTFTFDALSKRLEHIEKHPDEEGRPMIFNEPSPGLASPVDEALSPKTIPDTIIGEAPLAPTTTLNQVSGSEMASDALSPLSKHTSRENHRELSSDIVQNDFDGGIKLRKKPSSNFGAPFGQLGGYRKPSRDQ